MSFLAHFGSESRNVLSAILTASSDCIKLINVSGELEYLNPNGAKALGVDNPENLLGVSWLDFWPPESRQQIESALASARRNRSTRFEGFCPDFRGQPRWWDVTVSPVVDGDGTVTHILAISRDVTGQVNSRLNERLRREQAEKEASFAGDIAREMRHRLKNQLAVVGAVAKLLARHTEGARELAFKLEDKLLSLARAQDLLTIHRDQPVKADEALIQVLAASGAGDQIEVLSIPPVELSDESVQTMALILGELQTNALKHGALRRDEGRIQISGSLHGNSLTLRWTEDCGCEITPPSVTGGGFQLVNRLGAGGDAPPIIDWSKRGVVIEFGLRCAG